MRGQLFPISSPALPALAAAAGASLPRILRRQHPQPPHGASLLPSGRWILTNKPDYRVYPAGLDWEECPVSWRVSDAGRSWLIRLWRGPASESLRGRNPRAAGERSAVYGDL